MFIKSTVAALAAALGTADVPPLTNAEIANLTQPNRIELTENFRLVQAQAQPQAGEVEQDDAAAMEARRTMIESFRDTLAERNQQIVMTMGPVIRQLVTPFGAQTIPVDVRLALAANPDGEWTLYNFDGESVEELDSGTDFRLIATNGPHFFHARTGSMYPNTIPAACHNMLHEFNNNSSDDFNMSNAPYFSLTSATHGPIIVSVDSSADGHSDMPSQDGWQIRTLQVDGDTCSIGRTLSQGIEANIHPRGIDHVLGLDLALNKDVDSGIQGFSRG